jgi:hypothetical protein
MRRFILLVSISLIACDRGNDAPMRRADGSLLSSAGGEVSLADGSRLQFVITSERYKQWDAARSGLSRSVVSRFGALLKPKSPTQQSIAQATAFLQSDPQAKQSIERTGMSVADFVLMTVALEQEMQQAGKNGQSAAAAPAQPYPADTAYTLPTVPPAQLPVMPAPQPVPAPNPPVYDSVPRRDSMRPPVRPDSTIRRDSVRVDTPTPKRDSIPNPPPDTTSPPDSDAASTPLTNAARRI